MTPSRDPVRWHGLVIAAAALVALASARDYVGGWNDSSRLATVESLVDRHTWAIDDSPFLGATQDKLLIGDHYYSDKSPVPAALMAGEYAAWRAATGQTADNQPELFCWVMTLGTSGFAYVVAVWSIFRLGRPLRLPLGLRVGLTASFALATVALPYARHVNNHILMLGVAAALLVELVWLAEIGPTWPRLVGIGALAGLAYTIDLGGGPVLVVGTGCHVLYRCRLRAAIIVAATAFPWVVLHHSLNFLIGGTWRPANAVPAYLSWPGSPFDATTMTGEWNHAGVGAFALYALDLLFGKRGFLGHNLALYLAVPAAAWLLWSPSRKRPEVVLAVGWCVGVWLVYAATSTNYSGACCSVRWFVPLLAPGYLVLAVFLYHWPTYRRDFAVLSAWGAAMGAVMWWKGPWMLRMVPQYWVFVGGAAASWGAVRWSDRRGLVATRSAARPSSRVAA
jgi:hypothetical protein